MRSSSVSGSADLPGCQKIKHGAERTLCPVFYPSSPALNRLQSSMTWEMADRSTTSVKTLVVYLPLISIMISPLRRGGTGAAAHMPAFLIRVRAFLPAGTAAISLPMGEKGYRVK